MKQRIKRLKRLIQEKQIDAIVITSRANTFYLSGFGGSSSVILVSKDKAFLGTDFRYIENAEKLCGENFEVEMFKSNSDTYMVEKTNELGLFNIGFEEGDVSQGRYSNWCEKLPKTEFIQMQNEIDLLRIKKDAHELKLIQRAVDISDQAFSQILDFIKPGISENDIAAELEYIMRKNGASSSSFESIVASGKRSSLPHGHATDKIIQKGDPITMDFGALAGGYCSDMTRTVFVGKPDHEMEKIYNIVLETQQTSEDNVHAGLKGFEVDKISRDIIYGAGYEGCYGHGLGHGVGIMVHENPRLSQKGNMVLEDGMVVTVEPGIYVKDFGGVRIENMVVVNGNTPIVMTKSPKDMIIL